MKLLKLNVSTEPGRDVLKSVYATDNWGHIHLWIERVVLERVGRQVGWQISAGWREKQ